MLERKSHKGCLGFQSEVERMGLFYLLGGNKAKKRVSMLATTETI